MKKNVHKIKHFLKKIRKSASGLRGKNLTIFLLSLAVVGLAGVVFAQDVLPLLSKSKLTPEQATSRALAFINNDILQGMVKAETSGEPEEVEGCLYKFNLKIGDREFKSYITKSGNLIFPQGFVISNENKEKKEAVKQEKKANTASKDKCESVKKAQTPQLEAFVVSYCPFGLQMQRILTEITKEIPELSPYITIRYLGAVEEGKIKSMHGDKEAQENLRQICLRQEQPDKFFDYLRCFIKKGETEKCLVETNVDREKLSQCMEDKNRGIEYAKKDFAEQDKYNVTASPTLVLNGERVNEFDFGGRSAEAVKTLICCGFEEEKSFCSKGLSSQRAATGFSSSYSGGGESSGSCQ